MNIKVITPWHNPLQLRAFCNAWDIVGESHPNLLLVNDDTKAGCAETKNKGIRKAIEQGADAVIVLDDDCYPDCNYATEGETKLDRFIAAHVASLTAAHAFELCPAITDPPSRGTPYMRRGVQLPPSASMGYWKNVGDYDAPAQLVHGATRPMEFRRGAMFNQYFALSGMNVAFWTKDWPWFKFVNVPRFDDIWMGFIFQRHTYATGRCISLNGPSVTHARQSNVWANLRDEAKYLEANETMWMHALATAYTGDYFTYVKGFAGGLPPDVSDIISALA